MQIYILPIKAAICKFRSMRSTWTCIVTFGVSSSRLQQDYPDNSNSSQILATQYIFYYYYSITVLHSEKNIATSASTRASGKEEKAAQIQLIFKRIRERIQALLHLSQLNDFYVVFVVVYVLNKFCSVREAFPNHAAYATIIWLLLVIASLLLSNMCQSNFTYISVSNRIV